MIIGVGVDIVAVERITALLTDHGARFLERCFRPAERELVAARGERGAAALAARWAAREAFLKALGTNVRYVPYRDVEVVRDPEGPVRLALHGRAATVCAERGGRTTHLSLSHERDHAVAVVIIEG
ncbi:MAG: holo-[acyl-carrier-protein] synthase [bacterium]|nr:holo-[acyl-carrier-protein] synthase [bacterium]